MNCLIVDDSAVMRKLAGRMLKELGLETSEAEDGLQALERCKADMPEIVLLDWNMPNLDGLGFLKALRALPDVVQPKVIFCTTETDFSRIAEALAEGADEYIMKPFDEEILSTKLRLVGAL